MGKSKPRISKNVANSYTFQLLSASLKDPRIQNAEEGTSSAVTFKRWIPPNSYRKGKFSDKLPASIASKFKPEDFGIHDNLEEDEKEKLFNEIYGTNEAIAKSTSRAETNLEEEKEDVMNEEVRDEEGELELYFDKLAEADAYFPIDGYDYEQHLMPTKYKDSVAAQHSIDVDMKREGIESEDEKELMKAIEGEGEEFEELEDLFVAIAEEEDEVILANRSYDSILWRNSLDEAEEGDEEEEKLLRGMEDMQINSKNKINGRERKNVHKTKSPTAKMPHPMGKHAKILLDEDEEELDNDVGEASIDDEGDDEEEDVLPPIDDEYLSHLKQIVKTQLEDEEEEEEEEEEVIETKEMNWDCETILTTLSNVSHHPLKLPKLKSVTHAQIRLNSKLGMPIEYIPERRKEKNEEKFAAIEEDTAGAPPQPQTYRKRGEPTEERRLRKQAVKQYNRYYRAIKKENTTLLKEESKNNSKRIQQKGAYDIRNGVSHFKL